jgi:hypothetical protein
MNTANLKQLVKDYCTQKHYAGVSGLVAHFWLKLSIRY